MKAVTSKICVLLSLVVFLYTLPHPFYTEAAESIYVIGKTGNTWSIAEKDAYDEIIERVREKFAGKSYVSLLSRNLTKTFFANVETDKAKENRIESFYITYTLPYDIVDESGRVIYPKGYTFNPLDYVKLPFTIVFFDATSKKEVNWLRESGFLENWNTILITSKGNVLDAWTYLGRIVYAGSDHIFKYFRIEKTPAYVYQKDNYLVRVEVGVHEDR